MSKEIKMEGKIVRYIRKIEKCIGDLDVERNHSLYETLRQINDIVMDNKIMPSGLMDCLLTLNTFLALEMMDGGKQGSISSLIWSIKNEIKILKEKKGI